MRAHDAYFTGLIKQNDTLFNIPVYQRNYDWDTDNCQQLFNDIENITVTGKDHFIGSIVYISIGTASEPYFNIIDGQQRITSIMLFLKALNDSSDDESFKKKIRHGFLVNVGMDDEPKVKLKQVESDSGVYEKIVMSESFDEKDYTDAEKNTNVYRNYQFFKNAIVQSEAPVESLYDAIYKLEIIDVCLTTEDPQEVFESMNSTGKNLTNTDLLRNYLLMDLTHQEQERLYKKYWSQIEKNVGLKQMELYMVHYLIMKRKSDSIILHRKSAKVNRNTLYECFKLYFPQDKKKENGTQELLEDMYKYSVLYRKIANNDLKTDLDKSIHELTYELSADPSSIFILYLLSIQERDGLSDEEMLQAVKACISYVFRVRIFKGNVSNQFFALAIQYFENADDSKTFNERVWDSLTGGQGGYRFPRDREFQDTFENKNMYKEFKPQMLRYILYKYERARTKEVVSEDNVTIEHILPQNPIKWQAHLAEINDKEYPDQTDKIGNLTLTKMNSEASNNPFSDKKDIYKTSGYAITRALAELKDWNSAEIKTRSKEMAKEALALWPLPKEYNEMDSFNEWKYDVMDDDAEELFGKLNDGIKDFFPSIYVDPKKSFVNYVKDQVIMCSMIPYQSYITMTLNARAEVLPNTDRIEDISETGHWGTGSSRIKIETEDDIWLVLDCIQYMIDNPEKVGV